MRRRERRLRSAWRHEQLSVAMALAAAAHHSAQPNAALRGQKPGTRAKEGEVREEHQAPRGQTRLPPGMRPALLVEVQPQGCVERHIVEDPSVLAPIMQILDAPVPQMVDTALDFFRRLDLPVAEQVIDVPMISSSSSCPSRAALSEPLMVEQLVEVPTIISYSSLQPSLFGEAFKAFLKDKVQKRVVEQAVDFPVPGGGGPSSGLQGLPQGQGSTAVFGAENVDTPVPHGRGGGARGSLHGLSQGQGSTAVRGAEHVVTPVPHGGDLHGLSQGQGSTALCGADHVDIPVPHGRVGKRGLHGFPRGQSSTASAVEQTFSQAPHRSLSRAPVHGRHDEWVCVIDVENDGEYYWNRWDNSTCWRLPRGVKHRWCLLPSGLYRDVVLQVDFRDLPPL